MSAFFMKTGAIDDIVKLHLPEGDDPNELGRNLMEMNRDAVACRYDLAPDNDEYVAMTQEAEAYVYQEPETSRIQQIKSLASFTYQCSEGQVPHRPLFIEVSATEDDETASLDQPYTQDPAYQAASWDRPRKENDQ